MQSTKTNANANTNTNTQVIKRSNNYPCEFCGKNYKSKSSIRKHELLCEIIYDTNNNNKNKRKKEQDDDQEFIPSAKQMYHIIVELSSKYVQLQDKVNMMASFVQEKKKKINVKDWLNNHVKPEVQFNKTFFQNIAIVDTDISCITSGSNNFYDMLHMILSRVLYSKEEKERPLFALTQRPNCLYIYDEEQRWQELTQERLIYVLNIIHFNCVKALSAWNKRNLSTKSRNENEILADIYSKATIKMMSIDFKRELTLSRIKGSIYENVKQDMKALVQVEFEF